MRIRHSTEQDVKRIMEIYSFARRYMAEHGNPNQWGPTNWPPEDLIHNDIKGGNSYVCLNDEENVIGTFFFIHGSDIEPTYRVITDGAWLDDGPYGVVHRIAGDGSEKGIGAFCISWAFEQCGHLRIDTHSDNTVMQSLLKKMGFAHCGIRPDAGEERSRPVDRRDGKGRRLGPTWAAVSIRRWQLLVGLVQPQSDLWSGGASKYSH